MTFGRVGESFNLPPKTEFDTWNSRFQKARKKFRAFAFEGVDFSFALDIVRPVKFTFIFGKA